MSEYERIIKSGLPLRVDFDNVILGWKIYYNNGNIYTSLDGNWLNASSVNIAVVLIFYKQTYPIIIDGVQKNHNYRDILDEGKYFWYKLIDGIPTYGQCDPTDLSLPTDSITGEIKTWNGGNNFQEIWNNAYIDNEW